MHAGTLFINKPTTLVDVRKMIELVIVKYGCWSRPKNASVEIQMAYEMHNWIAQQVLDQEMDSDRPIEDYCTLITFDNYTDREFGFSFPLVLWDCYCTLTEEAMKLIDRGGNPEAIKTMLKQAEKMREARWRIEKSKLEKNVRDVEYDVYNFTGKYLWQLRDEYKIVQEMTEFA